MRQHYEFAFYGRAHITLNFESPSPKNATLEITGFFYLPQTRKFFAPFFALHMTIRDMIHKRFLRRKLFQTILPETNITPGVR